jgi:hypothetical protein
LKGVVNRKGGVILPENSLVKKATATALSFNKEGCQTFFPLALLKECNIHYQL